MAHVRIDSPFRLTIAYLLFGVLWIVGSDAAVMKWQETGWKVWMIDASKGLFFMGVTAALLYRLSRGIVRRHEQMTEELRETQMRWQFALEGAGEGVCDWNIERNEVFYSTQCAHVVGCRREDLPRDVDEWQECIHPDDRSAVKESFQQHLSGASPIYCVEYRFRNRDGTYRWLLARGKVVSRAADGAPLRLIVTLADTTSRRESAERTNDLLTLLQAILHSSPAGIVVYSADGKTQMANESAARIVGTDRLDLLQRNFRDHDSWRRYGQMEAAERALATGHEVVRRGHFVTSYGREIWSEEHFVPFQHCGKPHLLRLLQDETEQHRLHKHLHLMNTAVQAAPGGWVVTDTEGNIQWANPGFTALTGYTANEAVGKSMRILRSNQQSNAFYARMWQTIKRGEVWSGEIVNQRKDGSLYHEYMTIAPVRDDAGNITQFVAMKQDITERKNLEKQLARTQRLESIGMLASGIAHDLNNILAPITLSLELLKIKYPDAPARQHLELMERTAQRGAGIVKQVLTFARGIDGERTELQPKHLLRDIVEIAAETFPRNIEVESRVATDTATVVGDVTQLHQVLLNLAVNARDAMPNGGTLCFSAENLLLDEGSVQGAGVLPPGRYVALKVKDTGTGIPPQMLDRIFEPFFTTKPHGKGTGLGLSTVYGIVRNHGGLVEVSTELGKGTEFCVLLPAAAGAPVAGNTRSPLAVSIAGGGRRVLVVDDEEAIRIVTSAVLRRHGFVVETAVDGVDALRIFRQNDGKFDAVLTDLMMPRMNGYELVAEIRSLDARIPIVASSGMAGEPSHDGVQSTLASLGIWMHLTKPYTEEKLLEALASELKPDPGA